MELKLVQTVIGNPAAAYVADLSICGMHGTFLYEFRGIKPQNTRVGCDKGLILSGKADNRSEEDILYKDLDLDLCHVLVVFAL